MSPRVCRIAVLALVGWVWTSLLSSAASSSAQRQFCRKQNTTSTVQVPVEVEMCAAGSKFVANLIFQEKDGNPMAYLDIEEDDLLRMMSRMTQDGSPKPAGSMPRNVLRPDGCLLLKIKLNKQTDLELLSHDDSHRITLPVTKTASIRVKVEQPHDFRICFLPKTEARTNKVSTVTLPKNSTAAPTSTQDPGVEDQVTTTERIHASSLGAGDEVLLLLYVQAGLVGVALVLSVAALNLTVTLLS